MTELEVVLNDLTADGDQIDQLVAGLDAEQWKLPTPATGWTIADQIAHLTFVFRLATTAATDAEAFAVMTAGAQENFDGAVNAALKDFKNDTPEVLLAKWRAVRREVVDGLAAVPAGQIVPWLVNPLPPIVLACAGIMEQFAHGQDIADALGVRLERTDRLGHLVLFAVLTRDFGYQSHGLTPPSTEFRFEITGPSGVLWAYGPEDGGQRISGPAEDFCLLVTRRRHRADVAITAVGDEADHWLDIAQAYRGPAGEGRTPGQFAPALR
ncbi:TIGR03084 family metal-binding protein [Streptosporangium sp. KLBMP 9127]|nr:TIGR03084 family metal-binding protein [Streptosporangium sp. KLBMP 9127]